MNKQLKQHLEAVVTSIIEQDTAAGKQAFHDYLRLKSKQILMGEAAEEEDEDHDDDKADDKSDEDKSDDKADDKKSDDKADDKKSEEDCEM